MVCLPRTKQHRKPTFTSLPSPQEPAIRSDALPINTADQPSPSRRPTNDSSEFLSQRENTEALHAEIQVLKGKICQLESMESILQAQVQQKEDALNMLAHEVRTPLHSLLAAVDFVSDTRLDATQTGFVEDIAACGAQLMSNMNSVLENAEQHPTSTTQPGTDCFTAEHLLHHSQTLLRGLAERKGVTVTYQMPEDKEIVLEGDRSCLTQVILNLGSNAIKFTPSGGEVSLKASVEAVLGEDAWSLRVEVSDTGPGLCVETQDKLFQRFTQADSSVKSKFGGSGLGLWICKTLIEDRLNGRIGILRTQVKGSTFWFQVALRATSRPTSVCGLDSPRLAPPPVGQSSEWAAAPSDLKGKSHLTDGSISMGLTSCLTGSGSSRTSSASRLTLSSISRLALDTASGSSSKPPSPIDTQSHHSLLVVDDDPATRRLMGIQVRSMGFQNVTLSASGKQALEMFLAQPFSVVLTDHHIGAEPDAMHGPELVSALRAHQNTQLRKQPLVIIGITGDSTVQLWEGVDRILRKPFRKAKLHSVLAELDLLSSEDPSTPVACMSDDSSDSQAAGSPSASSS